MNNKTGRKEKGIKLAVILQKTVFEKIKTTIISGDECDAMLLECDDLICKMLSHTLQGNMLLATKYKRKIRQEFADIYETAVKELENE